MTVTVPSSRVAYISTAQDGEFSQWHTERGRMKVSGDAVSVQGGIYSRKLHWRFVGSESAAQEFLNGSESMEKQLKWAKDAGLPKEYLPVGAE